ncbi:lytic transglycosylase domain-containing protein [Cupriavidus nantongensis]|uniref:Transglycosylase SLT domain-containing protein n=1 Tax=Cupriavidus nantongensis TaxID=1796606 RepID=A0A142JNG4_9BURK|nr:transglycosylase SLT domain-containing protein [Cupriavidus nantongensis]AMR79626.1 hypothetical protein A2G96_18780 [Cupriavidus nantongensis]
MADELDKFVLQYTVELRDSITRLEKLNERVSKANESGDELSSTLGKIGTSHPALGRLTEKAEAVRKAMKGAAAEGSGMAGALRAIAPSAAVAAAAIGTIVGALKLAQKSIREYQEQADLGLKTGTSILGAENLARGLSKSSGGLITREGTQDLLRNLGGQVAAAYADPSRQGVENLKLRSAGINVTNKAGKITSADDALMQLSEKLKTMTDEEGAAKLELLGIDAQYLQGIKALTAETMKVTEMSDVEAKRKAQTIDAARRYTAAMGTISAELDRAGTMLGDEFAPALAAVAELTAKAADWLEDMVRGGLDIMDKGINRTLAAGMALNDVIHNLPELLKGGLEGVKKGFGEAFDKYVNILDGLGKEEKERQGAVARQQYQNLAQENLNINNFSQAVQDFSQSIDEQQAIAAWAGEVGRAAGLSTSGNESKQHGAASEGRIGFDQAKQQRDLNGAAQSSAAQVQPVTQPKGKPINNDTYDAIIKDAAKANDLDPLLIKKVIAQESGFNPKAVSSEGAQGLMQVMPANHKSLGITDGFDPRQNIMGGAKLLAQYIKDAKGDVDTALKMYHGGYKRSGWGVNTNAYPGKVLSKNVSISGVQAAQAPNPGQFGSRYDIATDPSYKHPVQVSGEGRTIDRGGRGQAPVGESRESIQRMEFMKKLAAQLHVPVNQLLQGDVTKGDVQFAQGNLIAGALNSAQTLLNQAKNPLINPLQRAELQKQMMGTYQFLQNAQNYGPGAMAAAKEGNRSITIGEGAVVVNVTGGSNGSVDQYSLERTITSELRTAVKDIVNQANNGLKY